MRLARRRGIRLLIRIYGTRLWQAKHQASQRKPLPRGGQPRRQLPAPLCDLPVDKLLPQTQQEVVAGIRCDLAHPLLPQRGQHLRKLTGDIFLSGAQREANPYRLHRAVSLRPLTVAQFP